MDTLKQFLQENINKNIKSNLWIGLLAIGLSLGFWTWYILTPEANIVVPRILVIIAVFGIFIGIFAIMRFFLVKDPTKLKIYKVLINESEKLSYFKISRYVNQYTFIFFKHKSLSPIYITLKDAKAEEFLELIKTTFPTLELRK